MSFDSIPKLPVKVRVKELLQSRYPNRIRPDEWNRRKEGNDVIRTDQGQILNLWSAGGQSPPQNGWSVMLQDGDAQHGYRWTLYGLPRA